MIQTHFNSYLVIRILAQTCVKRYSSHPPPAAVQTAAGEGRCSRCQLGSPGGMDFLTEVLCICVFWWSKKKQNKGPCLRWSVVDGNERKISSKLFSNQIRLHPVTLHILFLSSLPTIHRAHLYTKVRWSPAWNAPSVPLFLEKMNLLTCGSKSFFFLEPSWLFLLHRPLLTILIKGGLEGS